MNVQFSIAIIIQFCVLFPGEAVSTDAIRNCHRLLRQWGVVEMYDENKTRCLRLAPEYDEHAAFQRIAHNIYKFNVDTKILRDK